MRCIYTFVYVSYIINIISTSTCIQTDSTQHVIIYMYGIILKIGCRIKFLLVYNINHIAGASIILSILLAVRDRSMWQTFTLNFLVMRKPKTQHFVCQRANVHKKVQKNAHVAVFQKYYNTLSFISDNGIGVLMNCFDAKEAAQILTSMDNMRILVVQEF